MKSFYIIVLSLFLVSCGDSPADNLKKACNKNSYPTKESMEFEGKIKIVSVAENGELVISKLKMFCPDFSSSFEFLIKEDLSDVDSFDNAIVTTKGDGAMFLEDIEFTGGFFGWLWFVIKWGVIIFVGLVIIVGFKNMGEGKPFWGR